MQHQFSDLQARGWGLGIFADFLRGIAGCLECILHLVLAGADLFCLLFFALFFKGLGQAKKGFAVGRADPEGPGKCLFGLDRMVGVQFKTAELKPALATDRLAPDRFS